MDFQGIKAFLQAANEPAYRFKQLTTDFPKHQSWAEFTVWPGSLRESFVDKFPYTSYVSCQTFTSPTDGTVKAVLKFKDGRLIETVLMQSKPGHWSVCVSCEAGCPMNCAFCATGQLGFGRRLTTEEITDQVFFWQNFLKNNGNKISSIVFMGMGEPFHNTKAVFEAVSWLHEYYHFGYRHISISTCGLPEGIEQLSSTYPQVNLAISLHGATDIIRNKLMPVNKLYSLDRLKQAISQYMKKTNREVTFEYLLLEDVNDTKQVANDLITWVTGFPKPLTHINLIRYNETGRGFKSPSKDRVRWFKQYLESNGVSATIRKNLGTDIDGACGQLAAKVL